MTVSRALRKLLNLPEQVMPLALVPIGYTEEKPDGPTDTIPNGCIGNDGRKHFFQVDTVNRIFNLFIAEHAATTL